MPQEGGYRRPAGGDEFVVLLEGVRGEGEALALAERIAGTLEKPFSVGEAEWRMSANIGMALSTLSHKHPEDLLRYADLAMYRSKREGKGRVGLYEAPL